MFGTNHISAINTTLFTWATIFLMSPSKILIIAVSISQPNFCNVEKYIYTLNGQVFHG